MSVYLKLNKARLAFHALKLEKTGYNKFAGYKYFELGDFLIPALKVFDDAGLCAVVSFEKEIAAMMIVDVDKPESSIVISSPMGSAALKGCHEVQNIGAVETYQRRYLWTAALEIVEHDALDATTAKDSKRSGVDNTEERKDNGTLRLEGGAHSGPELIFRELPPEVQDGLRKMAPSVTACMPNVRKAKETAQIICDEFPDVEINLVRTGLWYLLDSKTRSAIKGVQ